MTMKQLTNSMDMMRQACAPKFKVEEGMCFLHNIFCGLIHSVLISSFCQYFFMMFCVYFPVAELHGLRKSIFPANPDKELKCYAMCIAQMAGTVSMLANISSNSNNMVWFPFFRQMTKKGEISFSKTMAQIEAMLPPEMKTMAKEALTHCKDTRMYDVVFLSLLSRTVVLYIFCGSSFQKPHTRTRAIRLTFQLNVPPILPPTPSCSHDEWTR